MSISVGYRTVGPKRRHLRLATLAVAVLVAASVVSGLTTAYATPGLAAGSCKSSAYACTSGGYAATSGTTGNGWAWKYYGEQGAGGIGTATGPHNCTLYAAWRLQQNGVTDPGLAWGNASQWGVKLAGKTNRIPAVGSIAWWQGGNHVAYVEEVSADRTRVRITADNYVPAGGFTDAGWVPVTGISGFIHIKDVSSQARNLVANGGFESGTSGWDRRGATTNWAVYSNGQVPGESARSARHYLATNTSSGSVSYDIQMSTPVPGTYCGNAWVRTQKPGTGAAGSFVLWLLGGSYNEQGVTTFTNLGNGTNWREVSTCVTSTTPHSTMRVEFYPTANGQTLEIDDIDVH